MKQASDTGNNTYESQNNYAEWRKPDAQQFIVEDSICVNLSVHSDRGQLRACLGRGLPGGITKEVEETIWGDAYIHYHGYWR